MAFFDLPLNELRTYRPTIAEPDDFDQFWRETLAEAAEHELHVRVTEVDNRQKGVDAWELVFAGYGGTDVRCWLLAPAGTTEPTPTVVKYIGYSGHRGFPFANEFVGAGFVHLVVDPRGQGWYAPSIWTPTDDEGENAGDAGVPGFMTRGIRDKNSYYYRRVYVDALRAIHAARTLPIVDASNLFVAGSSQGGGITIAAAALASMSDISLTGAMADVPFLCHFARAVTLTDSTPYSEVANYLRARPTEHDKTLATLAYFDGVSMARRATVPALLSVGLMDQVCPPSTVFAAYNAWAALVEEVPDTRIEIYPHAGHESGGDVQTWKQLGWLAEIIDQD